MGNFFIAAPPRCRTAWMSVFLTHEDTFCFHEATRHSDSVEVLVKLLRTPSESTVGTADCALPFCFDRIHAQLPSATLLIIERPYEEVARSLKSLGVIDEDEMLDRCYEGIEHLKRRYSPPVFNFHSLDSEALREIWSLCTNDPLSSDRLDQMMRMKIELTGSALFADVSAKRIEYWVEGE